MPAFQRLYGPFTTPHYVIEEIVIDLVNGQCVLTKGPTFFVCMGGMIVAVGSSAQNALQTARERNAVYEAHFEPPLVFHWTLTWAEVHEGGLIRVICEYSWTEGNLAVKETFGYWMIGGAWTIANDRASAIAALTQSRRHRHQP